MTKSREHQAIEKLIEAVERILTLEKIYFSGKEAKTNREFVQLKLDEAQQLLNSEGCEEQTDE